ncbi:unnamed protein product [Porites evermanni]|uniref:Uncharacterized protein n=1 Tax=Porites evermanni TaxID=104178 RepID=A0ABN8LS96_9CNID|nr:unnamed protein product [Porites evermanni]
MCFKVFEPLQGSQCSTGWIHDSAGNILTPVLYQVKPFQDIVLHEGSSNHPELSITQQAVHLHVSILDFAAYCKYKKRMRFEPNMQHVLGTVKTIVQSWIAFLETVGEKDEVEQLKAFNTVIAKAKEEPSDLRFPTMEKTEPIYILRHQY